MTFFETFNRVGKRIFCGALVVGTLALVGALAAVQFASRKIDAIDHTKKYGPDSFGNAARAA